VRTSTTLVDVLVLVLALVLVLVFLPFPYSSCARSPLGVTVPDNITAFVLVL
jgi:hypothetical protein